MQEENIKQNVNVGVGVLDDPHFRETTKKEKGITLIALIITIIVMLILVGVSVTVALNGGLFSTAEKATTDTEKEVKAEQKLSDGKIKIGDNWYASYQDYVDGIILESGLVLQKNLTLEIPEEYDAQTAPVTKELTVELNEIEGNITWTIDNEEVATIVAEGTKVTITVIGAGTAKITATCEFEGETYTAECELNVEIPISLAVGSFIEYDVEYTDAYEGYEYTKNNGWRLLSFTDNGDGTYSDVKLMSTGIPAILSLTTCYNWMVTTKTSEDENVPNLETFKNILGGEEYEFADTSSGLWEKKDYSLMMAAGLYYNFGEISFQYGTSTETEDIDYFTKIKNNEMIYGDTGEIDENGEKIINTDEKTGRELFLTEGTNAKVRLITLPEMNNAINRTDIDSTETMTDPSGASGLFVLQNLKSLNTNYDYSNSCKVWTVSPTNHIGDASPSLLADNGDFSVFADANSYAGVRPVICLESDVQFVNSSESGVYRFVY